MDNKYHLYWEITKVFMVPRLSESAISGSGDACRRGHYEEDGSVSEDHSSFLYGHADHFHPPLHPPLLHGLSHTESLRDQSL